MRATLEDDNSKGAAALLVDRCISYVSWLRYWQADQPAKRGTAPTGPF